MTTIRNRCFPPFEKGEHNESVFALNRKNALFAGSDGGGEHWAIIASLIETCKLGGIDPQIYIADVITRIVNGHPNSRIDELLPWTRGLKTPLTPYHRLLIIKVGHQHKKAPTL